MFTRSVIKLVFLCLFIASCSFPGVENTPIAETSTSEATSEFPEVTSELATATNRPENTEVVLATDTPVPTQTPELPLIPTLTPFPEIWYIVQPGTPLATFNTPHQAAGCAWLGVGGQVFGPDSAPVLGLSILVGGTLDGHQVGSSGTTGMETNIGDGGYEITLADHPIDSGGTLWIQIVDENGNPLSDKILFDTVNDCERNFILINFVRYIPSLPKGSFWPAYLPFIANKLKLQATPIP